MVYESVTQAFADPKFKFKPEEIVHPAHITAVGREKCVWYVSLFQVNYLSLLRGIVDAPLIVNTWATRKPGPGYYVGRGTRPPSYRPKGGGALSMHYMKLAVDCSSPAYNPHQLFEAVMANEATFKEIGLTTIESLDITLGWLHADARPFIPGVHPQTGFLIVGPS